jgi:hypothetical protein
MHIFYFLDCRGYSRTYLMYLLNGHREWSAFILLDFSSGLERATFPLIPPVPPFRRPHCLPNIHPIGVHHSMHSTRVWIQLCNLLSHFDVHPRLAIIRQSLGFLAHPVSPNPVGPVY